LTSVDAANLWRIVNPVPDGEILNTVPEVDVSLELPNFVVPYSRPSLPSVRPPIGWIACSGGIWYSVEIDVPSAAARYNNPPAMMVVGAATP
jgi:hypothetical protein